MLVTAEKIKEQVLKTGEMLVHGGLVTGTSGNISARVPGERLFVITPSGIPYDQMKINDLVLVDDSGNTVDGERRPTTEWRMHLAIYGARADVEAVVHTHSVFASALAVAGKTLPPILEDMAQLVGGEVPLAGYARAGTDKLAAVAAEALGRYNAVLLANHGLAGVGRDVDEAYQVCLVVEKAARVYAWASLLGNVKPIAPEDVMVLRSSFINDYGQPGNKV